MKRRNVKLNILGQGAIPASLASQRLENGKLKTDRRSLILVHPPQRGLLEGFSTGLVALANHVSDELPEVRVKLLDLGLASEEEAFQKIEQCVEEIDGQLFVGVTTTTASYQAALSVANAFKAADPSAVVILGGHHASAQDDIILENPKNLAVDIVVRGEGEIAIVELLRRHPHLEAVPNISYRNGLRPVIQNEMAPTLDQTQLDRIHVTFKGWGLQSAPGKFDHTTYVSARGCPLRCAFCSVANERIRNKSVEAVIRDLRFLVDEMGYKSIAIEDNFFAHSPRRTIEICQAIEELQVEVPFRWDCQTRVESCQREDVLEAMERAGCESIYLGVESFDPEQLLYLNKTRHPGSYLSILQNKVVPWMLRSTIDLYINLQLGLPDEGPSHRLNTLKLLKTLGQQASDAGKKITVFPQLHVVYPGTGHFHQGVVEGRFGPDGETVFERFTEWEARQQPILEWLGEHFAHGTGGIPEGILFRERLRKGEFEVNPDAIINVVNYLNAMAATPGIEVFKYGRYLAGSHRDSEKSVSEATH